MYLFYFSEQPVRVECWLRELVPFVGRSVFEELFAVLCASGSGGLVCCVVVVSVLRAEPDLLVGIV